MAYQAKPGSIMSAGLFELMLQRIQSGGGVHPQPVCSPSFSAFFFHQHAAEMSAWMPSPKAIAEGYYLRACASNVESDQSETVAEFVCTDLNQLLEAYHKTVKRIDSIARGDPGGLQQLRLRYARAYHPDILPKHLQDVANDKLADINARIDAVATEKY